jgi:carbon monoxide dehydrogenase subunit G
MRFSLSDKIEVEIPIDTVLDFSTNLREVASCIPNMQDFNKIDEKSFTINVTFGVAFVKGIFAVKGTLVEQNPEHILYRIEGEGIGSSMKIMISIDLSRKGPASTEIAWRSDAELTGLVSGLSESVLRKVSEDNINGIIANFKANLEKSQKHEQMVQ